MKYYSELGDDRFVYETFFKYRSKPGIYLEAYASDGIQSSSTKAFEEIGWTGILIEPIPEVFTELVKNRPKNKCLQIFLDNKESFVKLDGRHTKTNRLDNIIRKSGFKSIDALFLNLQGTSTEYKVIESLGTVPVGVLCLKSSNNSVSQSGIESLLKSKGYKLHKRYHDKEIWEGLDRESFSKDTSGNETCAATNFVRILVALVVIHIISNMKV